MRAVFFPNWFIKNYYAKCNLLNHLFGIIFHLLYCLWNTCCGSNSMAHLERTIHNAYAISWWYAYFASNWVQFWIVNIILIHWISLNVCDVQIVSAVYLNNKWNCCNWPVFTSINSRKSVESFIWNLFEFMHDRLKRW